MASLTIGQVLVALAAFLVSWAFINRRRKSRMPPGPLSLPILGGVLSLGGGDVRESMLNLKKKYGDVFTIDLGKQRIVVLSSHAAIKEAFVKNSHAFSSRPDDLFFITEITQGNGR